MKNNKAITLVALIITIIVLLILAMVSISLIINSGIITKTKTAVDKYSDEEIEEQIKVACQEYQMSQYLGTDLSAEDFVKNKLKDTYGEEAVSDVSKRGNSFIVTFSNGKIYTYNAKKGTFADLTNTSNVSKSANENFVGCYADIDSDGEVDGVIFADLLVGSIKDTQHWGNEEDEIGTYEISTVNSSELKDYYISKENHDGIFGVADVLSPKGEGKDRFYVMSLSDIKTSSYTTFYWYYDSLGKLKDYSENSLDFGMGRANTELTITKWNGSLYGEQNDRDIWKYIQTEVKDGWFIPSIGEWAAFANELGITSSNFYSIYKLTKSDYWTSSKYHAYGMYKLNLRDNKFKDLYASNPRSIRLTTTF